MGIKRNRHKLHTNATGVSVVINYLGIYSVKVISTEIYMLECPLDKVEENKITFSRRVLAIPPTLPPLNPPLDERRILAPADLKFVVSFPRYGHLKLKFVFRPDFAM